MTSVPYSASYSEPHRAFAALSANRALRIGTTSCGPAVVVISSSTPAVVMVKSSGSGSRYPISVRNCSIGLGIDRLDDPLTMPLVDAGLQIVAPREQVLVLRCQVGDDLVHARPEGVGIEAGTRQGLIVDEVVQHLGNTQVAHLHAIGHVSSLACKGA